MMATPLLFLAAAALLSGVNGQKKVKTPLRLKVYAQSYLRSVRKVNAADATFVVEGQINYAYRQDALYYSLFDGDAYNSAITIFNTDGGGAPINATDGLAYVPLTPNFPTGQSLLYSTISWSVNYGTPTFTGLKDSKPDNAADLARDFDGTGNGWLYDDYAAFGTFNTPNPSATQSATCTVGSTSGASVACSSVTGTLIPKMSCQCLDGSCTMSPSAKSNTLYYGEGSAWTFGGVQSGIRSGSILTCTLWGVPPTEVWVVGTQRFGGTFLQSQDLRDFPFDTQFAGFTVEATNGVTVYQKEDVEFVTPAKASSTIIPEAGVDGWSVLGATATAVTRVDKNLDSTFSAASFVIRLARVPTVFVNRFVTPLCLISLFVIGSLLYTPNGGWQVPRFTGPTAGFAMVISFLFVAAAQIPILTYSTRLDKFFLLCFFNSFCVFWYSILTYLRNERWSKAFAEARNRNKGRLDFFMVGYHAEAAAAASVAAADKAIPLALPAAGAPVAAATAVTVAPPPPAAPKPKPGHFFGVLAENVTDQLDLLAFLVFSAAFLVGAALILAGPSNVTGAT